MRFAGADISLNHGAIVLLDDDGPPEIRFFTDKVGLSKSPNAIAVIKPKNIDSEVWTIERLTLIESGLIGVFESLTPDYVAIEGYAHAKPNQAHQLGEVGGRLRSALYDMGIPYRIHDPKTVKLFATDNGNASKEEMVAGAKRRTGLIDEYQKIVKDDETLLGDIADAYFLACMAQTEYSLRTGAQAMSSLSPHELRAFNRVTTTRPENILSRPWTHWNAVPMPLEKKPRKQKVGTSPATTADE